jgi:hypothetical protein
MHLWGAVDGLCGEEAAEVGVRVLCSCLQLPLQSGDPALHQVHIVQEHPAPLLHVFVQHSLRRRLLALSTNRNDTILKIKVRSCRSCIICVNTLLPSNNAAGVKRQIKVLLQICYTDASHNDVQVFSHVLTQELCHPHDM